MKRNKQIIIFSGIAVIIFFICSVLCEWVHIDLSNVKFLAFLSGHRVFVINIFISLFTGSILSLVVALLDYLREKQDVFEQLPTQATEVSFQVYQLLDCFDSSKVDEKSLKAYVDSLSLVLQRCYSTVTGIHLFCKNRQKPYELLAQRLSSAAEKLQSVKAVLDVFDSLRVDEREIDLVSAKKQFIEYCENCNPNREPISFTSFLGNYTPKFEVTITCNNKEEKLTTKLKGR